MKKVAIHSVPRSGSSWLGSIFDSSPNTKYRYQPLFSYTHKGQLSPCSSAMEIDGFFNEILNTQDSFVLQKEAIEQGLVPRFEKEKPTHVVYKEVRYHHVLENMLSQDPEIKVVGLIRNALAVISSWLKAPKEFKKELGWKIEDEWRFASSKNMNKEEEFNGFEKWKETVFMFLKLQKKFPNQFYLLNYDDLLINKHETIKDVFDFCKLNYTKSTQDFLDMRSEKINQDAYSVFKTKSRDVSWQTSLPSFIIEAICSDEEFQFLNQRFQWIN